MPVKSLDFIVFGADGARLLVDVKGRRFPGGPDGKPRRVWECWSTRDDIDGLERWAELLRRRLPGPAGLRLPHPARRSSCRDDTADLWTWRGRRYLLRAVDVDDYRQHMRVRSPRGAR